MRYFAAKGVIEEIAFTPEKERLTGVLTGRRLDVEEIREALERCGAPEGLYRYLF